MKVQMGGRGRYNSLSASTSTLDEYEWKSSNSDSFNSEKKIPVPVEGRFGKEKISSECDSSHSLL